MAGMDSMTPSKDRLVHMLGLSGQKVTYEQARDLLDHPDQSVRLTLASRDDLEPEILYFLARDPDIAVRRAIAVNYATPIKASLVLAADENEDVRCDLADRVGRLVPGLSQEEQAKAWRTVHQVLNLLARDQLPRVRRALAEALKSLADAPHDIVLTLAKDPEQVVSTPVLEFSPVLTDEDLQAVIQASPMTAQLAAISRRLNVGEEVSNAIVGTGNVDAITALLKNASARIREETLDAIIDAAPRQNSWHEPLVSRPHLNARAALRIAEFVAESLIQKLAQRTDIDAETVITLTKIVREKLRREETKGGLAPDDPAAGLNEDALKMAARQIEVLASSGKLNQNYILNSAEGGATPLIIAGLAHLASLPMNAVAEVVRTASAKGMLAVAWAGDFSAEDAVQLQMKVARIPPDGIIKPRAGGGFDSTEAELEWQLDMFKDIAEGKDQLPL
jgi:uncharacterized protein (DUF2336 family)